MNRLLPDPSLHWPLPREGVALIAEFEGCRLRAYKCPAGVWTIGWGETDGVTPNMAWTQEQADVRFCESLVEYVAKVQALLTLPPTRWQLAAMTSLAYNIGLAGFARSTVLKAHNAGRYADAARAFELWNKARVNGVLTELDGLVRRRKAEGAMYLREDAEERMPQAVDAETPLAKSPIQQGGAVTAATGVGTVLAAFTETFSGHVSKLATMAKDVGLDPLLLVGVVLVVAGGTVLYWRWKQRKGGWA